MRPIIEPLVACEARHNIMVLSDDMTVEQQVVNGTDLVFRITPEGDGI